MVSKKYKYFAGFLLIAAVIAYLLLTSFKSALQYYVTVSELKSKSEYYASKVLKVAGRANSIRREESPEGGVYYFNVEESGATIEVSYKGIIPDTFKEGSDVVVTGRVGPSGLFLATEILAKCASKYEAKMK